MGKYGKIIDILDILQKHHNIHLSSVQNPLLSLLIWCLVQPDCQNG